MISISASFAGVGFAGRNRNGAGEELIVGLCDERKGRLEFKTSLCLPAHPLGGSAGLGSARRV